MMRQFVVDAFADAVFSGNPAAVCVIAADWPDPELMGRIAMENNLSETAFLRGREGRYGLRWFTPTAEIDCCGHATLASAFVVMNHLEPDRSEVVFFGRSGELTVRREGELYAMDFPVFPLTPRPVTRAMTEALGAEPKEAWMGIDLLCVFDDEALVRAARPDMARVAELEGRLVHISAPGRDADCVSRSFGPKYGIPEDPVCGSGHCHIAPYWQRVLGKDRITAHQASRRGGTLHCRGGAPGRLILAGRAALFATAELHVG